ncbi:protein TonB-like [Canis lupus dingo]|uniref:protein TonB-like n=1 Tax=Canis lupus dingo TaxID=286419 RepID=UPI0020C2980C|nr:protein TonB-like [Canis lupus dingo]
MAVSGKENGFFGKEKPNLSTDNFLLIDKLPDPGGRRRAAGDEPRATSHEPPPTLPRRTRPQPQDAAPAAPRAPRPRPHRKRLRPPLPHRKWGAPVRAASSRAEPATTAKGDGVGGARGRSAVATPQPALLTGLLAAGAGGDGARRGPRTEDSPLSPSRSPALRSLRRLAAGEIPPQHFLSLSFLSLRPAAEPPPPTQPSLSRWRLELLRRGGKGTITPRTLRKTKGLFCSNAARDYVMTQGAGISVWLGPSRGRKYLGERTREDCFELL